MTSQTDLPAALHAKERYSIDELATLAGVTPRTVRYYIAEGLLDRPEGEKRGAHYGPPHLERLLQIRRWTDAGLSLERIRELIGGAPEDPPRRAAPALPRASAGAPREPRARIRPKPVAWS